MSDNVPAGALGSMLRQRPGLPHVYLAYDVEGSRTGRHVVADEEDRSWHMPAILGYARIACGLVPAAVCIPSWIKPPTLTAPLSGASPCLDNPDCPIAVAIGLWYWRRAAAAYSNVCVGDHGIC